MSAPIPTPRASRAARVKQADVARAIKGALATGLKVVAVEVAWDGTIRLVLSETAAVPSSGNPLDKEFGCDGRG